MGRDHPGQTLKTCIISVPAEKNKFKTGAEVTLRTF